MKANSQEGTSQHFNFLARVLHWLMAFAIVAMLLIGVAMTSSLTWRPLLLDLHRPLGIAILLLVVVRLANRLLNPAPPLPSSMPRWQVLMAKASHWLLYLLMFSLPILGWASLSAGNWPVTLGFGFTLPPIVPHSSVLYAWLHTAHAALAWLLFFVVVGHLSAALLHAWVYRDGVFSSMAKAN